MDSTTIELATGARLFVARKGSGDELVVFLHSAGGDHTAWYHQMEALGDRYTCVSCDLRGHGRSAFDVEDVIVREAISTSSFAKDAIALVERHGFRRAHLVGLGLGGVIALEVFRRRSDLVQSLTLCGAWAHHTDGESHAAARPDTRSLFSPGTAPALVERAVRIEEATNRHVNDASWQAMFANDYRRMLELIDVPLLLIAGSNDPLATLELVTAIQNAMTSAELVTIEGAGHYANLDHPNDFTRALRAHLLRSRAAESPRIGFPDATPIHGEAATVGAAVSALLVQRGIRCFATSDDATSTAMAHGAWLVSGRPHAALTDDALLIVADPGRGKWERDLAGVDDLETIVDRAAAIAASEPAGFARIGFPVTLRSQPIAGFAFSSQPRQVAAAPCEPWQDAIERAVQLIAAAQRPLAIVGSLGRYRGGLDALVQLAQRHGVAVVEDPNRPCVNFPTRHPMHLGFDATPFAKQADLILSIESVPDESNVAHGPRVIQLGVDPLQTTSGTRGFPADLVLAGNPALTLRRLYAALDKARPDRSMIDARMQVFASEHRRVVQQAQSRAIADAAQPAITKAFLSYCLGEAIPDATIVVNDSGVDPALVPRRLADTWFEAPLGAAVGVQTASPDTMVVAALSASRYMRDNPLAAHHAAATRRLPIAIVVLNDTNAQLEKLAESCGGAGFRAESPRELAATLRRALDLARERRQQVLVNAIGA